MEAEAFWELFKEYEDAGGDGYIVSVNLSSDLPGKKASVKL